MSNDPFVHLHTHSDHSLLDGAARIEDMVIKATQDNMPALAITDHGTMSGVLDFYKSCKKHGINGIIGSELNMALNSVSERPVRKGKLDDSGGETEEKQKAYYHLTVLAENNTGYKNLMKLSSRAYLEGYYIKSRADWSMLEDHHEGLIVTTGCLGGQVLQALLKDDFKTGLERAAHLQDIFGRDNMFVELQNHNLPEQTRTNPQLIQVAKTLNAPLIATNDSHYTDQVDSSNHDIMLCLNTASVLSDPNRFKFTGTEHYLKTSQEMRELFSEIPESCDNTLLIAERCKVEIEFGKPQLPDFPIPAPFITADSYLEHLTMEGAHGRWDELPIQRIKYELKTIKDMGFSTYFLIVWDLIKYAHENNIRTGPGRGSSAGAAVSYCLQITDIDPIKYGLLFERFLNPSRVSMPDIDLDLSARGRDKVIQYITQKYGRDHVAQIITFTTLKSRSSVRDAARILGHPYSVGHLVARTLPPTISGKDIPLSTCFDSTKKGFESAGALRELYMANTDVKEVVDAAKGLEGLIRGEGQHASAILITKSPLTEHLPIQRKHKSGTDPELASIVTQYGLQNTEDLGLLKIDFLGLRNLDVITDTLAMVGDVDINNLEDEKTFELLRSGNTIGVFQLEGKEMRKLLISLAPTVFEDLGALVALYRPGPMADNMHYDYADRKNGRKSIEYIHPDAAEILDDTYGLCIQQDQKILTSIGPVKIKDIEIGTKVLGEHGKIGTVSHKIYTGLKKVFSVSLSNGRDILCSGDHLFLTPNGYIKACELNNKLIATSNNVEQCKGINDPDGAIILGGLLAEGYLNKNGSFDISNNDAQYRDYFIQALHRRFINMETRSEFLVRCWKVFLYKKDRHLNGYHTPNELKAWIRALGLEGKNSWMKFIPNYVFQLDNISKQIFLGMYLSGDGHISPTNNIIQLARTVSRDIAYGLHDLLISLGIFSNCYYDGSAYTIFIQDNIKFDTLIAPYIVGYKSIIAPFGTSSFGYAPNNIRTIWQKSTLSQREFTSQYKIGRSLLTEEYLIKHPYILQSTATKVGYRSDHYWVIAKVKELDYVDHMWDVTVKGTNSFIVNSAIVHNCIYQEELMTVAQKFAGYTLAEADNLRKACGKKIPEAMTAEREKFIDGCEHTGYGRELGTRWWEIIEPFAAYAFPKSHSVSYALISYQTAYLKAHYPVEYMACLLTSVKDKSDKAAIYLHECKRLNIPVLIPDINRSEVDFTTTESGEILFGLAAIRGISGAAQAIVSERSTRGPYLGFSDYCRRVDGRGLDKGDVTALIEAGAFTTSLGYSRKGLLEIFSGIIDETRKKRKKEAVGQYDLFAAEKSTIPELPTVKDEFSDAEKLDLERKTLGLYVSGHPLIHVQEELDDRISSTIQDLETGWFGVIGGIIDNLNIKTTRAGDKMAILILEDLTQSTIEVVVFPKLFREIGHLLREGAILLVKGHVEEDRMVEDKQKFLATNLKIVEPPLVLDVTEDTLESIKKTLLDNPGPICVHLKMDGKTYRLPKEYNVSSGFST